MVTKKTFFDTIPYESKCDFVVVKSGDALLTAHFICLKSYLVRQAKLQLSSC